VITAWDYEDDLKIIGIVYAQVSSGRHPLIELTLDLIDSPTNHLIKRVKLSGNFQTRPNELIEVCLRLDADICLVSIARSSRSTIHFFRLTHLNE